MSVHTISFQGVDTRAIEVQVHLGAGLPTFGIVGLADKTVGESKERVRAAIHSLGLSLHSGRITVNLAPADLQKEGSHYDLPIALALLIGMGILTPESVANYVALGELSLDGRILSVPGVLPASMHAVAEKKGIICPESNGAEARWSGLDDILAPAHLLALINHFKGTVALSSPPTPQANTEVNYPDMCDVKGQAIARRALEVAASGGHNMLMVGPPGSGKSMLASRLPGLLPPLDSKELLENSVIASVAGLVVHGTISAARPFREPHHSCSMPALVGGGRHPRPGEITLAHNGVLFLDELPEMQRSVMDALRQPLENGTITIARAEAHISFPARFQLVVAMNPCRCGYLGDLKRQCTRVPRCGVEYQSKLSGPLLDRIDMHIEVPALKPQEIANAPQSESTAVIASRVLKTRTRQAQRYAGTDIRTNAQIRGNKLEELCVLTPEAKQILAQAMEQLQLSMRAYHRVLRVALTIADMETSPTIHLTHMAEALSYRQLVLRRE